MACLFFALHQTLLVALQNHTWQIFSHALPKS
jgi:hypothetical protein